MTSIAIGPMPPAGSDDLTPVVKLTKEPAGLRIELLVSNASSPTGTTVFGRTIPVSLVAELHEALGFLRSQWGQV